MRIVLALIGALAAAPAAAVAADLSAAPERAPPPRLAQADAPAGAMGPGATGRPTQTDVLEAQPGAAADQRPPAGPNSDIAGGRPAGWQDYATRIIGMPVFTADGQEIGDVADLLLDVRSGAIDSLVIGGGRGPLGMGEPRYAVPWPGTTVEKQQQRVLLGLRADEIRSGPGASSANR